MPERQYTVLIHVQDRSKPAMPKVHTCSSPYHPHSVPITLHIFHYQLSVRNVPSFSVISAAFFSLLVSHVEDGTPQRSDLLRSQLVLFLKRRAHEIQTTFKRLLRHSITVVQRIRISSETRTKVRSRAQNGSPPLGSFCSSFCKERRIQPVLIH